MLYWEDEIMELKPERSYFVRTILDDPGAENRYYWVDCASFDNRIHLYSGYWGEDGAKDRKTEEDIIVFDHGFSRYYSWTEKDMEECDAWIESIMEKELGFVPCYEIG